MTSPTKNGPELASRRLPRVGSMQGVDTAVLERGRVATESAPLPAEQGPQHRKPPVRPSSWILNIIAAVTGLLLALFVTVHMVGNIKVFQGPEAFNSYAHWLRVVGDPLLPAMGLLWIVRFTMAGSVILHIWSTLLIRIRGAKLRGETRKPMLRAASFISRLMLATGLVLMVFIIIHIFDLTTGHLNGSFLSATATESFAYENLIASFERLSFAIIYMVSMLALAAHLIHGLWLLATDFGVTGARTRYVWKGVGYTVGVVVALINISIPIAVQIGALS